MSRPDDTQVVAEYTEGAKAEIRRHIQRIIDESYYDEVDFIVNEIIPNVGDPEGIFEDHDWIVDEASRLVGLHRMKKRYG